MPRMIWFLIVFCRILFILREVNHIDVDKNISNAQWNNISTWVIVTRTIHCAFDVSDAFGEYRPISDVSGELCKPIVRLGSFRRDLVTHRLSERPEAFDYYSLSVKSWNWTITSIVQAGMTLNKKYIVYISHFLSYREWLVKGHTDRKQNNPIVQPEGKGIRTPSP